MKENKTTTIVFYEDGFASIMKPDNDKSIHRAFENRSIAIGDQSEITGYCCHDCIAGCEYINP